MGSWSGFLRKIFYSYWSFCNNSNKSSLLLKNKLPGFPPHSLYNSFASLKLSFKKLLSQELFLPLFAFIDQRMAGGLIQWAFLILEEQIKYFLVLKCYNFIHPCFLHLLLLAAPYTTQLHRALILPGRVETTLAKVHKIPTNGDFTSNPFTFSNALLRMIDDSGALWKIGL